MTPNQFTIDHNSSDPIYLQLLDQVRRLVASGRLQSGEKLPSVREMASTHDLVPMTVSKAYSMMVDEGLTIRHRGQRMTIAAGSIKNTSLEYRIEMLRPALLRTAAQARQLGLTEKQAVLALKEILAQQERAGE